MGLLEGVPGGVVGVCCSSWRPGPDLSVGDLDQKLAHLLPQTVDKMTPDGVLSKA